MKNSQMSANRNANTPVEGPRTGTCPYNIPDTYQYMKYLGEGIYGEVLECQRKDDQTRVAIKVPKNENDCTQEAKVLRKLMKEGLDQYNIIKLLDSYSTSQGEALVFEILDLSLLDHLLREDMKPMELRDIRAIVSHMAVALKALKTIGLIHADLKLNNVMLVDQERPLRAKLIDFGMAMDASKVELGMIVQNSRLRAPEVFLGLPITEAIDMWTLGCMMFTMLFCDVLMSSKDEDRPMASLVDLLGMPPDQLLENGLYTAEFFTKKSPKRWKFWDKTQWVVKRKGRRRRGSLRSLLKRMKKFRKGNNDGKVEYQQCIELLMAMLTMSADERITPQEVLEHPFITQNSQCSHRKQTEGTEAMETSMPDEAGCSTAHTIPHCGEIKVQHAPAENRRGLEDDHKCSPAENRRGLEDDHKCSPAENRRGLEDDHKCSPAENRRGLEDDHKCSPAENRQGLEDDHKCSPAENRRGLEDDHNCSPAENRRGLEDDHNCSPLENRRGLEDDHKCSPAENRRGLEDDHNCSPLENSPKQEFENPAGPCRSSESVDPEETETATPPEGCRGKKRKNVFQRSWSWMKKHTPGFGCLCCTS